MFALLNDIVMIEKKNNMENIYRERERDYTEFELIQVYININAYKKIKNVYIDEYLTN